MQMMKGMYFFTFSFFNFFKEQLALDLRMKIFVFLKTLLKLLSNYKSSWMRFAQLLWLASLHSAWQAPAPWSRPGKECLQWVLTCWLPMGSSSLSGNSLNLLLAFVNSKESSVRNSHKVNITSLWGKKWKAFFSFIFTLSFKFLAVLVRFWQMVSLSPFPPPTLLCWQGRNRKVCRVFWVSVQNDALFLVIQPFAFQAVVLDKAVVLHDNGSWEILLDACACFVCSFNF